MVENLNSKFKKANAQVKGSSLSSEGNFKPSTFAPVHAPVQSQLDKVLPMIIGSSYLLVAVEQQESTDPKNGEVQIASVYTLRVISRKARAFRDLIQIKVKNAKPVINEEELDKVLLQQAKPIILRFEDIAHYAYMGGETLNASKAERLNVSVQEAMSHE